MRRQDKYKVIMEANQRLEENYLKSKGLITEAKDIKQVVGKIEDKIEDILSPEEIQFLKSQNPETIANVIDNKIDESDDNSGKLKNIIDKIVKNTTIASLIGVPVAMMTQATIAAATGTPGAQGVISGGQNIISPEAILGLAITGVAGLAIRNSDWWIKRFGKNDTNKKVNEGEGLIKEDILELKQMAKQMYSFLKKKGFGVKITTEEGNIRAKGLSTRYDLGNEAQLIAQTKAEMVWVIVPVTGVVKLLLKDSGDSWYNDGQKKYGNPSNWINNQEAVKYVNELGEGLLGELKSKYPNMKHDFHIDSNIAYIMRFGYGETRKGGIQK